MSSGGSEVLSIRRTTLEVKCRFALMSIAPRYCAGLCKAPVPNGRPVGGFAGTENM